MEEIQQVREFSVLRSAVGGRSVAVHARRPGAEQFDGWPLKLNHTDNGYPHDGLKLPTLRDLPTPNPIVQVIDQGTKEVIYTVRLQGSSLTPRVFSPGTYTVRIYDEDMVILKEIESLMAELPASEQ